MENVYSPIFCSTFLLHAECSQWSSVAPYQISGRKGTSRALETFLTFKIQNCPLIRHFSKQNNKKVLDVLLKNFIFYIVSFRALTVKKFTFYTKTVSLDVQASQAGMDNQSPLLCLLSSIRFILSPGAALAVKEVAFIRELRWGGVTGPYLGVFAVVCCALARQSFSFQQVGCLHSLWCLWFSPWWTDGIVWQNSPLLQLLSSSTPSHPVTFYPRWAHLVSATTEDLHNRLGALVNGDLGY